MGRVGADVRQGEALESKLLQRLERDIVEVVEIRGRRCRITSPIHGWVSMETRAIRGRKPDKILRPETRPPAIPDWARSIPLHHRLPHDLQELARVEGSAFLCVRDLVFNLANRPNLIENDLQVEQGGPYLASLGEEIDTSAFVPYQGTRCSSCPTPVPPPTCEYCCPNFTENKVLYLFIDGDELLLVTPSMRKMKSAKLVCCCYLYFTSASVDTGGICFTLRCRSFECRLAFESPRVCHELADRINQISGQRREGKCAGLAPVLMQFEAMVDPEDDVEN